MSSHRRATKYFSRKFNARKALLRGLIISLVDHERISTTVDKAKELKRHVEKAITLGKKGDLPTRRLLLARVPNEGTVQKIIGDLSVRFKSRPGGYTRIIKTGRRPGDTAEMAFIEFVDYDFATKGKGASAEAPKAKATKKSKAATDKTAQNASKEKAQKAKKSVRLLAAKRKNVSKIQKASRVANR